MKVSERLTRARIQIQKENPFFAFISLYLKFKESKNLPDYAGAGVDIDGNFYYKKEFFEDLTDDEIKAVVIHEILHLSLLHLIRINNYNPQIWNISADIVVNLLVEKNGYDLPDNCLTCNHNNEFKINEKYTIKKCHKKTAEQIYHEIIKHADKKETESLSGLRFDEHKSTKGKTPKELKELKKTWGDRLHEAYISAKMRGKIPAGIERLLGELHKNKINWKSLLNKYITNSIPHDFTYLKPNKKSRSAGYYIPDTIKEKIEIIIGIDLSGSVGEEELKDFLSEIIGIARAFRENISFNLITHDVEVYNDYAVKNGNIETIKQLKLRGGGGTAHKPIFDYIKEKYPTNKLSVFFTDGDSDINNFDLNKYPFNKLFVLNSNGTDRQINKQQAEVIFIK